MRAAFVIPLGLAVVGLVFGTPAGAVDRVRLVGGGSEPGDVKRVTRDTVALDQAAGPRQIPAVQIESILFDGEPPQLTQARINASAGGYTTALEKLSELKPVDLPSDLARQDLRFYTAWCRARLAADGAGDAGRAYQELTGFVRDHGDSFHYYAAVEALGTLLVSVERYDRAEKMFALLEASRTPAIRVRGMTLAAAAAQSRGDHAGALRRFDAALALRADGPAAERELAAARLGKAPSLAATGDLPAARELVAESIAGVEESDGAALARAYNALGRCCEEAGDRRGALLAYLHTDLLFPRESSAHAEALARLAVLWGAAGKPQEARDAADRLRRGYGSTRWARDAASPNDRSR